MKLLTITNTLAAACVMATATTMVVAAPTSESPSAAGVEVAKRDKLSDLTKGLEGASTVDDFHNWSEIWGGRWKSFLKRDILSEITKGLVDDVNAAVGEATVDDFHKWTAFWGERLKVLKRSNDLVHHHIVGPHDDEAAPTTAAQTPVSVSVSVSVSTVATCVSEVASASTASAQHTAPVPITASIENPAHPSSTATVPSSANPIPEAAYTNSTLVVQTPVSVMVHPTPSSGTNTSIDSSPSDSHSLTLTLSLVSVTKSSSVASTAATPTPTPASAPSAVPSTSSAIRSVLGALAVHTLWSCWIVSMAVGL